jgi:hypothetical protein
MRELIDQLNWVRRHRVAVMLYKSDWRGAVAAVPEPLQADMRHFGEIGSVCRNRHCCKIMITTTTVKTVVASPRHEDTFCLRWVPTARNSRSAAT